MKKLFRWGKSERDRARQAVVQGVSQYAKKKPKTRATRWGSIAALLIGGVLFIHTGNPQLAKLGGDLAGEVTELIIEERASDASNQ